jgi:hypothetical protein
MEQKLHLLESFNARGSDGATYKVCGYETLVRDLALPNSLDEWLPTGRAEYRTSDGALVDARGDGSMRVAASGVELTRA